MRPPTTRSPSTNQRRNDERIKMPNWVFTTLHVHGEPEKVAEFRDKAKKPYTTYHTGKMVDGKYDHDVVNESEMEGDLLFWNFIEPENKDAYFADAHGKKPEGYESWSMEERLAHDIKHTGDGWYDWNISNWGTKWEARGTLDQEDEDSKYLRYQFDTAWSPAEGAFRAMVEQHPDLSFSIRCEEEQGWGVEFESEDGELVVTNEWDIPESHADWVAIDNESRCICEWEEDKNNWYADCPNKSISEEELAQVEDLLDAIG